MFIANNESLYYKSNSHLTLSQLVASAIKQVEGEIMDKLKTR